MPSRLFNGSLWPHALVTIAGNILRSPRGSPMRRIYSSKTIETHSGLSANNLVYMCLHIPTNQPTNQLLLHQDIGLLLHPVGHFSPPRSLFLALTLIFAAAVARTMARAPFCQPHIAADHRDMQRLWINYFTGNRTSAAEFFFKKH